MSDFNFSSSDSGAGGLDSAQRAQLIDQVKTQVAVANAQELLQVCPWMLVHVHGQSLMISDR